MLRLCIPVVGYFQPVLYLIVDLLNRLDLNAMCDAIFFGEATSVDQTTFRFHMAEGKTEIDARTRGWFDLRKYVLAIKGHDGLAGTCLSIFSHLKPEF